MAAGQELEVRWIPGRGSCPGAVDITAAGPLGPIARIVRPAEALAATALVDALCPGSNLSEAVRRAIPDGQRQPSGSELR